MPPSPVPCIFIIIVTLGHQQQVSDESKACHFESDGETAALSFAFSSSLGLLLGVLPQKQTSPLEGAAALVLWPDWAEVAEEPAEAFLRTWGPGPGQPRGVLVDGSRAILPECCGVVRVRQCWWCGS